jgi:PIN domain nuclease of toxin-antitoxin system
VLRDTHALLWFVSNDAAMSASARSLIERADDALVSVASAWEIAIKVSLGKLSVDASSAESFFDEQMAANGFSYLPIAPAHVFRAAVLPHHHRDPFDRTDNVNRLRSLRRSDRLSVRRVMGPLGGDFRRVMGPPRSQHDGAC